MPIEKQTMSTDAILVEIKNMKDDIKELKEDRKIMVENSTAMKENVIRLTSLMEYTNKRMDQQDEKINEFHSDINSEIAGMRKDMNQNVELNTKWYQNFLSDSWGKTLKIFVLIILALLGVKLVGVDITKLMNFFN